MDLEKEIELLKEKVALLEKIKELQDASGIPRIPYVPYPVPYPVCPQEPWKITWTDGTTMLSHDGISHPI